MNITALEKIFERDLVAIIKQKRPYWKVSFNQSLSTNTFLVYEFHIPIFSKSIKYEIYHVIYELDSQEYRFTYKDQDINHIKTINSLINCLEGRDWLPIKWRF